MNECLEMFLSRVVRYSKDDVRASKVEVDEGPCAGPIIQVVVLLERQAVFYQWGAVFLGGDPVGR